MNERLFRNILKICISNVLYYSGILPLLARLFLKDGLYIFNYHSFNTFINDYYKFGSLFETDYGKRFERQIKFYLRYFKRACLSGGCNPDKNIKRFLITFDDGYKDNYTIAFPVIKKYNIPAIFFVATGAVGENSLLWFDKVRHYFEQEERRSSGNHREIKKLCKQKLRELKLLDKEAFDGEIDKISRNLEPHLSLMMDWAEIKECHEGGILIAPHSHNHYILSHLTKEQQEEEICNSIRVINAALEAPEVVHFSLPGGSFDLATIDILSKSGIRHVYLTEKGINSQEPNCLKVNMYKRIGINPSDPIPLVLLKIIKANLISR